MLKALQVKGAGMAPHRLLVEHSLIRGRKVLALPTVLDESRDGFGGDPEEALRRPGAQVAPRRRFSGGLGGGRATVSLFSRVAVRLARYPGCATATAPPPDNFVTKTTQSEYIDNKHNDPRC